MRPPLTNLTKNRAVLGASVAALALAGSGLAYATSGTEVTVSIDGTAQQISARGDTVREVLESQGIEVSDRDVVAPGLDAPVEDGDRIAVRFAREVNLNVDGEKSSYWVTANDVASALDEIGSRFAGAALSVSRGAAIGREGLNLEVATPKKLRVWVAGREVKKVNIAAFDAADLLEEMNVRADGDDEIKILGRGEKKAKWGMAKPLEDGDKVTFTRVREITKRFRAETVDFETIEREDDSMPAGETEVVRAGSTGTRDVTYRLRYENGELVARKVLRARVLSAPVSAIVRVGTQEAAAANFASGSTVWDSLAQCESGGNWAINTGNGYYGGLQFALSTWQSYGGTGYPHEASRETQIMIAERVRDASGGYGAWPACAAKLGLPT